MSVEAMPSGVTVAQSRSSGEETPFRRAVRAYFRSYTAIFGLALLIAIVAIAAAGALHRAAEPLRSAAARRDEQPSAAGIGIA